MAKNENWMQNKIVPEIFKYEIMGAAGNCLRASSESMLQNFKYSIRVVQSNCLLFPFNLKQWFYFKRRAEAIHLPNEDVYISL